MTLNKDLRRRVIEEGYNRKHGHYGSSMSCLDTVKFLYDRVLTKDDIFIMSKGHGAPALHAVLESKGITPPWTIHIEYDEQRGIKATGGSLGNGLSVALGRAYARKIEWEHDMYKHINDALKIKNNPGKVYCLIGDGELQEGMCWECFNIANRFQIHNLITLVDYNKYQAISSVKEIMNEDHNTMKKKLEAFGYNVTQLNGHDNGNLEELLRLPEGKLNAVILHTTKGKGIPVLERNPSFHVYYFHEHPEEMEEALRYLK